VSDPKSLSEPFRVEAPARQTAPVVFASPHSGQDYPAAFAAASRLAPLMLRRSEDAFVDKIFAAAPKAGAPLIRALFPRAFVDPNREPFELDPGMFAGSLPDYVNTRSPRVLAGLGTVARVVTSGEEIYSAKLDFEEILRHIEQFYKPYHAELERLVNATRDTFGFCVLIDCHSMPSVGGPMDTDPGLRRVDFVLGDCFGSACAPAVIRTVEAALKEMDYAVVRNTPYAGGFTTRHYGDPGNGVHALQIEINRTLYMDEQAIEPTAGLQVLASNMETLIRTLASAMADTDPGQMFPKAAQ